MSERERKGTGNGEEESGARSMLSHANRANSAETKQQEIVQDEQRRERVDVDKQSVSMRFLQSLYAVVLVVMASTEAFDTDGDGKCIN